jgi:Lrp/AsnC family transcriptional regulator, leucine-responsive regulatory protein
VPSRQRTSVGVVGEPVDAVARVPDADAVDPAAEVRRRRHVGRHRHDVRGDVRRVVREVDEEAAERLLGRRPSAVGAADVGRHRRDGPHVDRRALQPRRRLVAQRGLRRARREARPRDARVRAEHGREPLPLVDGQQRRVVGRVALRREPPRLDRVGEDHRRPLRLGVRGGERVEQRGEVVAAEVAHRAQQLVVRGVRDQLRDVAAAAARPRQPLAQLGRVAAQQPLVLLVRHAVDPPAQRAAAVAGEQRLQPAPVLDGLRLPAGRREHVVDPAGGDVGHDPVERLPVEVDDPQHLAEPRHHRVDQGLPDRALVQLRVAEQRDPPAALRHREVPGHVAVGDGAPDRGGRADADRPGGEVGGHRVLQPRRVALQPAELAQRRQVPLVERAEEVLDRVQHGRGVRLHRHAVGRPQVGEIERGHDRRDRRRRRLVPADLHARRRRADLVGVVRDRRGQPQDAVLDGLQRGEIDPGESGHGRDHRRPGHRLRRGSTTFAGAAHSSRAYASSDGTIVHMARTDLDATDQRIVDLLVADARLSASEVGRRVGLSPAAASRRIDRLERVGVITGYHAALDHGKLGGTIEAFVELRFAGSTQVDDIEGTADIPEVVEAYTTAGDPDALVRIRVHDLDHLKRVVDRIRRGGRVTGTKTLIVLGGRSATAAPARP